MKRAILLGAIILTLAPISLASENKKPPRVRGDVLAAIEAELAHLQRQSEAEDGPLVPKPAEEVAYLLLAGLASEGEPMENPSKEERLRFEIDAEANVTRRLITVGDEARLVKSSTIIQDKSGSFRLLELALYRERNGRWMRIGSGRTTADKLALDADAAKAKAALLRLLRANDKLFIGHPDPSRMERIAVEPIGGHDSQIFSWGGFVIDVKRRTYQAEVIRDHSGWFYSGTFQIDASDAWTADKPSVTEAFGLK